MRHIEIPERPPSELLNDNWDEVSQSLYAEIMGSEYSASLERVLNQECCDIAPEFLGFVKTYKLLSELIPLECTVYDVGCAYGVQGWYFRHHATYIGVDEGSIERVKWSNSKYAECSAKQWLETLPEIHNSFAICNYMNTFGDAKLVRSYFPNVYCYYP